MVYSWIEWPSKEVRDAAWPKVMADPRLKDHTMPFDGKRLIYGGFLANPRRLIPLLPSRA